MFCQQSVSALLCVKALQVLSISTQYMAHSLSSLIVQSFLKLSSLKSIQSITETQLLHFSSVILPPTPMILSHYHSLTVHAHSLPSSPASPNTSPFHPIHHHTLLLHIAMSDYHSIFLLPDDASQFIWLPLSSDTEGINIETPEEDVGR